MMHLLVHLLACRSGRNTSLFGLHSMSAVRMGVKFITFLLLFHSLLHLVLSQESSNGSDTLIENFFDADPIDRSYERNTLLIDCGSVGGTCMAGSEADKKCRGAKIEENTCDAHKPVCCINGCQEEYGFFKHYGQCFKFFDEPSTWSEAKQICEKNGLVLARPFEMLELRKFLVLRYGVNSNSENKRAMAWLDAEGNGTCVRWNHGTPGCISDDLPLWFPNFYRPEVGNCLILTSTALTWKEQPEATIRMTSCTGFNLFPLCELVDEYE